MPSLRLFSVVILIGMGAAVAAVGGIGEAGDRGSPTLSADVASGTEVGTSATRGATFDVAAENQRAGTPDWRITPARGTAEGLAGYAGAVSVLPGQPVPLSISGAGPVRIRALRIGWYGGLGARQVWEGTLPAQSEGADPGQWPVRGHVDTTGWPEGHYLLRLDQGQASRYVPLTVRSTDNRGRVVVLTSPLTWQAENTPTAPVTTAPAALPKISFNRPYASGYGAAGFLPNDAGIVQLAEETGHRIGFVTDQDVVADPALLKGAAGVLIGGDSQYWTASLRTAIRAAGDAGTNLAFFGAGTGARKVRVVDDGRALQISRTKLSTSVRLTGLRPSCSVKANGTGKGTVAPGSAAAGVGAGKTGTGWVVSNADWWGYRGTGVKSDDVLPRLVAGRVDRAATSSAGSTKPMQVLAFTRMPCGSDSESVAQSGVYSIRPSGAGVFTAGTGRWACTLTDTCTGPAGKAVKLDANTQRVVSRVTRNVINAFAVNQAGKRFAAVNNASQFTDLG